MYVFKNNLNASRLLSMPQSEKKNVETFRWDYGLQIQNLFMARDSSRFPRRRPYIYLNRHTPSGESRVHRVTQLRTDGVHCRESAGTELVVLKVVSETGAAMLQVTLDQLMCASLFKTHYRYEVGMLME